MVGYTGKKDVHTLGYTQTPFVSITQTAPVPFRDYINYFGGLLLMCDIATAFTAISTGVSMMGFFNNRGTIRQQENYEQQALEMQRRQQEENAKQAMLAAQQKANDEKDGAYKMQKVTKQVWPQVV